jgi:myotubularin-related protein 6/7/8
VRGNRSIQDEKLLGAIFSTSEPGANLAQSSSPPPERDSMQSSQEEPPSLQPDVSFSNAEQLEDEVIAKINSDGKSDKQQIYGAQQHNLIVDARPTVNAFAMQAVGLGSENMDNYRFATKVYLGIDNIHVMRKSLNRVIEALKDSDVTPLRPNREELAKSNWLKHIASILDGAGLIARQVGLQHSHVLIHCSDGWDRTSQLSALSQLCLDPYYRTLEGFIVLVEKDWLSFGHRFRLRAGYLNSEKWFHIENERIGGSESNRSGIGGTTGTGKALENALLSAKGFFNRDNVSKDSLLESDGEMQSYDSDSPQAIRPTKQPKGEDKEATKVNETSPVFHQFLDATYQLLYQHPTRFEFNERFLRRLLYHLYSCQYGTFLFDSEKDRTEAKLSERTRSVWDYFISRKEQFTNPKYEPIIDDNKRGQERLIFPRAEETRWWSEGFGRTDSEMNAPSPSNGSMGSIDVPGRPRTPVLTGVETADNAVGTGIAGKHATSMASIASSLSNFGLSPGRSSTDGRKSPTRAKEDMEVEMQ